MPVTVEYAVEREGMEKVTFSSKTEADAYDKLLDTADSLSQLLDKSALLQPKQVQELAFYLAHNRDPLINALAQRRKTVTSKPAPTNNSRNKKTTKPAPQELLDIVIEPDEEAAIKNAAESVDKSNEAAA
ncbi:hypothetical protein CBF23_006255 [Marinomonas agarivorans]|nr:hypothetical protein CBF23_006255 [Marinomonas agarivorans]